MVYSIIGYYGHNYGDLLMLRGIMENIPSECSYCNILSYVDLDFSNLFLHNLNYGVSVYNLNSISLFSKIEVLRKTDCLMWGGGSCFNDVDGTGGIKYMLLAKIFNPRINISYYGVGIDIKYSIISKLCLKLAVLLSDSFVVRDSSSFQMLMGYNNVRLEQDPIYLNTLWLQSLSNNEIQCYGDYILISYRNVDKYFPKYSVSYRSQFVENIKLFVSATGIRNVVIIDCDKDVDSNDNEYIYHQLQECSLEIDVVYHSDLDIIQISNYIFNSKYVITGRLHLAAIADLFNIRYYLLNYSSKNYQFFISHSRNGFLVNYPDLNRKNVFIYN